MAAQRARAELLVENLANSETTRTPDGGPYRRKDAVFASTTTGSPFSAVFQTEMGTGVSGVEVSDVIEDSGAPERRYIPGHPDADASGYVSFPRINPAEDMADLLSASRGFEGNVAAMSAIRACSRNRST